jgi:hypothetical protein
MVFQAGIEIVAFRQGWHATFFARTLATNTAMRGVGCQPLFAFHLGHDAGSLDRVVIAFHHLP